MRCDSRGNTIKPVWLSFHCDPFKKYEWVFWFFLNNTSFEKIAKVFIIMRIKIKTIIIIIIGIIIIKIIIALIVVIIISSNKVIILVTIITILTKIVRTILIEN